MRTVAPLCYLAGIALIVWGAMMLGGLPVGAMMLGAIIIAVTAINS